MGLERSWQLELGCEEIVFAELVEMYALSYILSTHTKAPTLVFYIYPHAKATSKVTQWSLQSQIVHVGAWLHWSSTCFHQIYYFLLIIISS